MESTPVKGKGRMQNWVKGETELQGILNRSHRWSEADMTILRCPVGMRESGY